MSDSTANVMDGSAWRNFSRALEAAGAIILTPYHASYMTAAEIVAVETAARRCDIPSGVSARRSPVNEWHGGTAPVLSTPYLSR